MTSTVFNDPSLLFRSISSYWQRVSSGQYSLWHVAIELVLIGTVVYAALRFLQGTRGARLLKAVALILVTSFLVVRLVAKTLGLERINFLYPYFIVAVFLVTLVAFQPELRRGLMRIGEGSLFRVWQKDTMKLIDPLIRAALSLSKKKIGALIAIQRGSEVGALIASGVKLDAEVTAELIESIFWPGCPLHDLGVIIAHGRIAAAGCQFPLIESDDVDRSLGSRHRAALGMSLESDSLVLIVSEETGRISLAERGRMRFALTADGLRDALSEGLGLDRPPTGGASTQPALRRVSEAQTDPA